MNGLKEIKIEIMIEEGAKMLIVIIVGNLGIFRDNVLIREDLETVIVTLNLLCPVKRQK